MTVMRMMVMLVMAAMTTVMCSGTAVVGDLGLRFDTVVIVTLSSIVVDSVDLFPFELVGVVAIATLGVVVTSSSTVEGLVDFPPLELIGTVATVVVLCSIDSLVTGVVAAELEAI